ncbi:LysR family transcriptional regulator [Motilimonas sp. 1_MG-2023]|uniref:LysR family transcriptional regulator n=1 Tax=Motilimonas sp. 1_MG-2023 TaxID=3062672 RepID=UPI0026E25295|nr:LysR family transcriptional regulator [Motilimonas sp. 1_MG-2023]MDO6525354.1 LysR family transcriptional regulator [Motilimonas sp. 1_MG-2023]
MDRLTAAKVFINVVQCGSFSAAADRLNMSRSMVTRYVDKMENWLQTRLLHRTTRKVTLTSAGETCLKEIEAWLEQGDKLARYGADPQALTGRVKVATSVSLGGALLAPAIKAFQDQHRQIFIDLDVQDSVKDMTEQQIDLAIRITASPSDTLIGKPIGVCESALVASPDYLAQAGAIVEPQDLTAHRCLGYKNFAWSVWHLAKDKQFEAVEVSCHLTANEATTLLYACLSGAGVSLQPTYLVNKYLKSGELCHVLPQWQPNEMKIYALYSSRKHLSPAIRALIDHLEQYFADHPW